MLNLFQQTSSSSEINVGSEIEKLHSVEKKLTEKVSILEFQVKAHRDDWEAERNEKKQVLRDKEALEQRVVDLMRELETVSETNHSTCNLFAIMNL